MNAAFIACASWTHSGCPSEAATLAKGVFEHATQILGETDDARPGLCVEALQNMCRQRCGPLAIDRTVRDQRWGAAFLFVAECQLLLRVLDNGWAEHCGEGSHLQRALRKACTPSEFTTRPISDVLEDTRAALVIDPSDCGGYSQVAFAVCFKLDGQAPNWKQVCTGESLMSHAFSLAMLRDIIEAISQKWPASGTTDAAAAHAWHKATMTMQHSDEFMCEISDMLIWLHMFEFESDDPEVCGVYDATGPRAGYHWSTRLRAARPAWEGNELCARCAPRTEDLDDHMKELTLLCYMKYHMKHVGADNWRELCYFDESYPRECIRAIEARQHLAVGHPRLPPMLLRTHTGYHVLHAQGASVPGACSSLGDITHGIAMLAHEPTLHQGLAAWCAATLRICDGMIAPRISCAAVLNSVLGTAPPVETEIDLNVDLDNGDGLFELPIA
jgi:hypothetical protein